MTRVIFFLYLFFWGEFSTYVNYINVFVVVIVVDWNIWNKLSGNKYMKMNTIFTVEWTMLLILSLSLCFRGYCFLMFWNNTAYVVVQFYPWFKFNFPLFQTHYRILSYPTKTKPENKFKPRIKLNYWYQCFAFSANLFSTFCPKK